MSMSESKNNYHLLTISLSGQRFGIDVFGIRDVIARRTLTPVPRAGENVAGMFNLRGYIVTAINLKHKLGMPGNAEEPVAIVVEHEKDLYGFLVDEVGDVITLQAKEVEPVPATLDNSWRLVAEGVCRQKEGLLILLNTHQLLQSMVPA